MQGSFVKDKRIFLEARMKGNKERYKALNEIVDMLSWGGFSYKANKIGSSPLHLLQKGERSFSKMVSFSENLSNGISPKFHTEGFIKPELTELITNGEYANSLVSPRSALEYSVNHNAAELYESPVSIHLKKGMIDSNKILDTLKSRCLKFNLFLTFDQSIETVNTIIERNVYDLVSKDLVNHYNTTGDFINLINFSLLSKIDLSEISLKNFLINLINEKHYKKDVFIKNNIYKYVEFYLLNLMKFKNSRNKITSLYKNFINKIHDLEKFNLDDESFFIEFKVKVLDE